MYPDRNLSSMKVPIITSSTLSTIVSNILKNNCKPHPRSLCLLRRISPDRYIPFRGRGMTTRFFSIKEKAPLC
jgi:hypothetical protein